MFTYKNMNLKTNNMETKYCKLSEVKKHKIIEHYPNNQFKKCIDKKGNEYRLHIIYPNDKLQITKLSESEIEWYCPSHKGSNITSITCNWFPRELVAGVINHRYVEQSELSKLTGWLSTSANTGSNMDCFLTSNVNKAIEILVKNGFEIE